MEDKVIIWGAGDNGIKWINRLGVDRIQAVVDKNKAGDIIEGIDVQNMETVLSYSAPIFISVFNRYARQSIINTLNDMGCEDRIIFSPYLKENIRAAYGALIDADTMFEGYNYIGENAKITYSNIGYGTYFSSNTDFYNVKIGKYCSIASNVSIINGLHPAREFVSTHPCFYSVDNVTTELRYVEKNRFQERKILPSGYSAEIGNDVWIGENAKIMDGICIGDGSIVGAGSLVTKNVPPYSVVGGIPASLIRMRFTESQVDFLQKLRWWDKGEKWIQEHAEYFDNISRFMSIVNAEIQL